PAAAHSPGQTDPKTYETRHEVTDKSLNVPAFKSVNIPEVAHNRLLFFGKPFDESLFVFVGIRWHFKGEPRINEAFEIERHLVPAQPSLGKKIHKGACERAFFHLAHIMKPDIPRRPVTAEHVRQPSRLGVFFQHEDLFP